MDGAVESAVANLGVDYAANPAVQVFCWSGVWEWVHAEGLPICLLGHACAMFVMGRGDGNIWDKVVATQGV